MDSEALALCKLPRSKVIEYYQIGADPFGQDDSTEFANAEDLAALALLLDRQHS